MSQAVFVISVFIFLGESLLLYMQLMMTDSNSLPVRRESGRVGVK